MITTRGFAVLFLLLLLLPASRASAPPICSVATIAGIPHEEGNASGPALQATFYVPFAGVLHPTSGVLAISDQVGMTVRTFDADAPGGASVATIAGSGSTRPQEKNGPALLGTFHGPRGLCYDPSGDVLYILDGTNRVVRALEAGQLRTASGDGTRGAGPNSWATPNGCAWDAARSALLVTDSNACMVRS